MLCGSGRKSTSPPNFSQRAMPFRPPPKNHQLVLAPCLAPRSCVGLCEALSSRYDERTPALVSDPDFAIELRRTCMTAHDSAEYRVEHDSMGDVRVPAQAYYGAQTQRAVENFPISGGRCRPELIHALGLVKLAAAIANRDLGKLTGSGKNRLNAKAGRRPAGRLPRSGRRASSTISSRSTCFRPARARRAT